MTAVSLEAVTYTYAGAAAPALRDVNLQIEPGELVVVAGASGSGKSTLLRAISGLVPYFHGGTFAGRAVIGGLSTRDHGPGELAAVVGTLFQDPEAQVVTGTARAELAFGPENLGRTPAQVARAVEETALALAIEGLLDRPTGELSGGELQRVALGAALSTRPQVVVLDEPTSQLDPVAGDELIGLLRRHNEDSDATIVLSEHRLERCLHAADRVIALAAGAIVCDGTPREFLRWAARSAPSLQTPGGHLLDLLDLPPVPGVKRARAALRERELLPAAGRGAEPVVPEGSGRGEVTGNGGASLSARVTGAGRRLLRRGGDGEDALVLRGVWHELRGGATILRDASLRVAPGERVALMGRNGAGKSTLLRHAAGLMEPTRGAVDRTGRVALLLQNPGDYLVHERVQDEAPAVALQAVGLGGEAFAGRHPRELSGGERQRLALAVVLGDLEVAPAVVCLDEPTRGMDRDDKRRLAAMLDGMDAAVIVATHDPEFVAAFASRVVLLADGAPIADGDVAEILTGGSYFATETARILGGAGGALTAEQGAALLSDRAAREVVA